MNKKQILLKEKVNLEGNFNTSDLTRNEFMLKGSLAQEGYDWWWHSFTGRNEKTGEEKAFFIEFFTVNPALGQDEPIFGQLKENKEKGIRPSYMMVKAGAWGENATQLHRFFGWNQVTIKADAPYEISAEDCLCSETETYGSVEISTDERDEHPEWMCDSGSMSWKLSIDKQVAFNVGYGAGKKLRDAEAFEMYWHAEGIKTQYEGEVVFNGEKYIISKENSYGYADKNWGSNFTSPWVWISSNHIRSRVTGEWLENTVFDIGGGRPKIGPVSLEGKLLSAMLYEGEPYEFNFSKFWTITKTKFKCYETDTEIIWKIVQTTPIAKMVTHLSCKKKDMLLVNYEAPDGSKKHTRLWNGGNGVGRVKLYKKEILINGEDEQHRLARKWILVDDMEVYNAGCEYGEYDEER